MTRKILTITLAILFILPVLCFAQDVEVGTIIFRWEKALGISRWLMAQIPITNHTDERCDIRGRFLFYDKDGFELRSIFFGKSVEAGESKVLQVKNTVSRNDYVETTSFKLSIEVSSPLWALRGKPPFKTEGILTLPPWD